MPLPKYSQTCLRVWDRGTKRTRGVSGGQDGLRFVPALAEGLLETRHVGGGKIPEQNRFPISCTKKRSSRDGRLSSWPDAGAAARTEAAVLLGGKQRVRRRRRAGIRVLAMPAFARGPSLQAPLARDCPAGAACPSSRRPVPRSARVPWRGLLQCWPWKTQRTCRPSRRPKMPNGRQQRPSGERPSPRAPKGATRPPCPPKPFPHPPLSKGARSLKTSLRRQPSLSKSSLRAAAPAAGSCCRTPASPSPCACPTWTRRWSPT